MHIILEEQLWLRLVTTCCQDNHPAEIVLLKVNCDFIGNFSAQRTPAATFEHFHLFTQREDPEKLWCQSNVPPPYAEHCASKYKMCPHSDWNQRIYASPHTRHSHHGISHILIVSSAGVIGRQTVGVGGGHRKRWIIVPADDSGGRPLPPPPPHPHNPSTQSSHPKGSKCQIQPGWPKRRPPPAGKMAFTVLWRFYE